MHLVNHHSTEDTMTAPPDASTHQAPAAPPPGTTWDPARGTRCPRCSDLIAPGYPADVPCGACLAAQLPTILRETVSDDQGPVGTRAVGIIHPYSLVGQPLPSAARLAPLPWLVTDLGIPLPTAATIIDCVADALVADHLDDAYARARLTLDVVQADRLVELILGAASAIATGAAA